MKDWHCDQTGRNEAKAPQQTRLVEEHFSNIRLPAQRKHTTSKRKHRLLQSQQRKDQQVPKMNIIEASKKI